MKNRPPVSLILLGLCLLITPFLYTESLLDPALRIKYLFAGILTLVATAALWNELRKSTIKALPFNTPIAVVIVAIIGSAVISIFGAVNKPVAVYEVIHWMFFFNLFTWFSLVRHRYAEHWPLIERALVVLSSILVIGTFVNLLSIVPENGYSHQSSYGVRFTFAHRNLLSQVLFLSLIIQLHGFNSFSKLFRLLSISNLAVGLPLIVGLLVRSVWLACAASTFSMGLLLLVNSDISKKVSVKKVFGFLGVGVGIVVVGLFFYSKLDTTSAIRSQTHFVSNTNYGSSLERIQLWKRSMDLIKQQPLTGVGGGNWGIRIAETRMEGMRSDDGFLFFQRPHNDFVWLFTEQGFFGGLLFLAMFVIAIWQCLKSIKRKQKPWQSIVVCAALIGYVTIAALSFPKERATHQIFLCLLLAMIPHTSSLSRSKIILGLTVLLPLAGFGSYAFYQKFEGERTLKRALDFRMQERHERVIQSIDESNEFWNTIDNTGTPIKWYSGSAHYIKGNATRAQGDFEQAYTRNPNHPHVLNNLASAWVNAGKEKQAKIKYWQAHKQAPKFPDPLVNLSAVYFNEGQLDSALYALAKVDPKANHDSYNSFLTAILAASLTNLAEQETHEPSKEVILAIGKTSGWAERIFQRAVEEKTPFRQRIRTEVSYVLRISK